MNKTVLLLALAAYVLGWLNSLALWAITNRRKSYRGFLKNRKYRNFTNKKVER